MFVYRVRSFVALLLLLHSQIKLRSRSTCWMDIYARCMRKIVAIARSHLYIYVDEGWLAIDCFHHIYIRISFRLIPTVFISFLFSTFLCAFLSLSQGCVYWACKDVVLTFPWHTVTTSIRRLCYKYQFTMCVHHDHEGAHGKHCLLSYRKLTMSTRK